MSTDTDYAGVSAYKDRHGKTRWRYRRKEFCVALRCWPGHPEFENDYKAARDGIRPTRWMKTGTIYVIQGAADTPVKIGFTSKSEASRRLSALQSGNSTPLRVIAQAPAYRRHENLVHKGLATERVHGEWFAWTPATREFVDALAVGINAAVEKIFPNGLPG